MSFLKYTEWAAAKLQKKDLLRIVKSLSALKSQAVAGDCGTFAYALSKFLQEKGIKTQLGAIVDNSVMTGITVNPDTVMFDLSTREPTVAHVFVWFNDVAIDIEGVLSMSKSEEYCKRYNIAGYILAFNPTDKNLQGIRTDTAWSNDWNYYMTQIEQAATKLKL